MCVFILPQLPWPRTQSERLLVDMFEGSSAQMLAVQEGLADSNRRTLISQPPAQDHEVEILDVFAEMFMAAQEIINGGGGAPVSRRSRGCDVIILSERIIVAYVSTCAQRSVTLKRYVLRPNSV